MREYVDRREWNLAGHEVTQIVIDYQFTLVVSWRSNSMENSVHIVIEAPFTLIQNGKEYVIEPGKPQSVCPALNALHMQVDSLTAYATGKLEVKFRGPLAIRVEPRDSYESWNTFGTGELAGIGMLCGPGGGQPWM